MASKTQLIMDWITSQPPHVLRTVGTGDIAKATGVTLQRVSAILGALDAAGRVKFIRGEPNSIGQRRIEGIEAVLRAEPYGPRNKKTTRKATTTTTHTNGADRVPERFLTRVATPMLDQYQRAQAKWESLKSDPLIGEHLGDFPAENPIANEALLLRQALVQRDEKYAELAQDYATMRHDYELYRTERQGKQAAEVHKMLIEARPEA